jgi:hypothetical protein
MVSHALISIEGVAFLHDQGSVFSQGFFPITGYPYFRRYPPRWHHVWLNDFNMLGVNMELLYLDVCLI